MAKILDLTTYTDHRGNLTVVENVLPFSIKRVYYIYGVDDSIRGMHRHHKTIQAAISIKGSWIISSKSGNLKNSEQHTLDSPSKCLLIYPEDFHSMYSFSKDCILMIFASEFYDKDDYIIEPYI